jgi:hypothetical protein
MESSLQLIFGMWLSFVSLLLQTLMWPGDLEIPHLDISSDYCYSEKKKSPL